MGGRRFRDIFELVVAFDELPQAIEAGPEPFEAVLFTADTPASYCEDRVVGARSRARRAAPAPADAPMPAGSPGYAQKRANSRGARVMFPATGAQFYSSELPERPHSPKRRPRRAHAALPQGCYAEGSEGDDVRWIKATLSEWDDKVLSI
jgi:hypothetical protein